MSRSLVSTFVSSFSFMRFLFCCCLWLRRMLLSTEFLFALFKELPFEELGAGWVREGSRCCHLSDGLYGQSRLAVIGTRCRRNGYSDGPKASEMVKFRV